MRIEEAIENFRNEILRETGCYGVVKIAFNHVVYDSFMHESFGKKERYRIHDVAEPTIMGIGIFCRERDTF